MSDSLYDLQCVPPPTDAKVFFQKPAASRARDRIYLHDGPTLLEHTCIHQARPAYFNTTWKPNSPCLFLCFLWDRHESIPPDSVRVQRKAHLTCFWRDITLGAMPGSWGWTFHVYYSSIHECNRSFTSNIPEKSHYIGISCDSSPLPSFTLFQWYTRGRRGGEGEGESLPPLWCWGTVSDPNCQVLHHFKPIMQRK